MTRSQNNILRSIVFCFFIVYPCSVAYMDASHPWQVGFQDPATPIMEGIIFFNGLLMTFMLFIACFVGWLLYQSLSLFNETVHADPVSFNHSTLLEVVWTIIPAGILMVISVPSYNLLYAMEEVIDPSLTIKVVGHQWYWSYECSDFEVGTPSKEEAIQLAKDNLTILKDWIDLIEFSRVEAAASEKQNQVIIGRKGVEAIEKVIAADLPKERYRILASRMGIFAIDLLTNEGRKEYYGSMESYTRGEMVTILSAVKKELSGSSLIKEQQDLVKKILSNFKQYLRIINEKDLASTSGALFSSLQEILGGQENSIAKAISIGIIGALGEKDLDEKILVINSILSDCDTEKCEDSSGVLNEFLALSKSGLNEIDNDGGSNVGKNDKSVGTMGPNLELSRAQRESYIAEAELDRSKEASDSAELYFHDAKVELDLSLSSFKWASLDLVASKVNQITAVFLKIDADCSVISRSLTRSKVLLIKGYDGWTEELRLKAKHISEFHETALRNASEDSRSCNAILRRVLLDLTEEESSKALAIAGSAEAGILAAEEEKISVEEELVRAGVILKNAEAELVIFGEIADRACKRLELAQVAFDRTEILSTRTQIEYVAAKVVFDNAQIELNGPFVESPKNILNTELNNSKIVEEFSGRLYKDASKELFEVEAYLDKMLLEFKKAEERVATVEVYIEDTTKLFNDTPIVCREDTTPEKPISYFDNFMWETINQDVVVVKAQLRSAISELSIAQTALDAAKMNCSRVTENFVEAELYRARSLANIAKVIQKTEGLSISSEEVYRAEKLAVDIELKLCEEIYRKALEQLDTPSKSNSTLLFLDRAKESLVKAKAKSVSVNLMLSTVDKSIAEPGLVSDVYHMHRSHLYSEYASLSLSRIKDELDNAEIDYVEAMEISQGTDRFLGKIGEYISRAPATLSKEGLAEVSSLLESTRVKLHESIAEFKKIRTSLSPLEIKLEPDLIGTRACMEVLRFETELANAKWLSFKIIDIVNKSTPDTSAQDSANDARGSSGGGIKSQEEIQKILSEIPKRDFSYTQSGLFIEILQTFKDLVSTLDSEDADDVLDILYDFLPIMILEEGGKNRILKKQIDVIAGLRSRTSASEEVGIQRINFDSYLIAEEDLVIPEVSGTCQAGKVFRLLEVDNRLFVPTNTHIRVLVTSADVLHSWAVPSLGVKVDACPGRLNQVFLFIKREGVFYGQCSELCGVNHGFMPIVVQAVNRDDYLTWVGKRLCP